MKRKFFPFLIVALSAVIAMALFACTKVTEPPSEAAPTAATTERKTNVLFLGDSIGEGLAGPAPLTERENYAYYGIIGNVNGYSYYNRAVTGYTTGDLLELVLREDDGINMVESLITTADLIHISIVGNDFLISNHAQMMVDLAYDNYSRITPRKTRAKANLDAILTRIRTLNPNAVIILQTLYNPADESTPLIPSSAKTYLTNKGIEPEGYHALVQKIVDEINSTLTEYLEEHTVTDQSGNALPPFELLDVYGAFEKIYEEDRERWTTLFYQDGYHPSAAGHAVIAEVLQQKLTELRLAAPNALHNYKTDKVNQLNRLYGDAENRQATRNAIMRAATFDEVSKAYFAGTKGLSPHYAEKPTREGKHFDESKTFDLTLLSVYDFELTGLLDEKASTITFSDDGKYTLVATLSDLATILAKGMIGREGGIDAEDYFPFDEATLYFYEIAPEAEKDDLEGVLRWITELYGLEIVGLDYENPILQEVFARYKQTSKLIIDDPAALGDTIAFRSTGTYVLEKVTAADGTEYTAIYVNDLVGRSESYMRFTYREDEDFEYVRMTIDVAKLEVEGKLRKGLN